MDDFVHEIHNVLPVKLCTKIIEKFDDDNLNKVDGMLAANSFFSRVEKNSKDSKEISITYSNGWERAQEKVRYHFIKALNEYDIHIKNVLKKAGIEEDGDLDFFINSTFKPYIISDHVIQRIEKNKKYRWHNDANYDKKHLFTAIIYLNTLGPDDGGRTKFINGREIDPVAGKMVIFPATWDCAHCGKLIKANAKYILVTNVCRGI